MVVLKNAFRNLLRNKRRTVLSVLCISVSIACFLVVSGYYEYNYWGLRESSIRSQFGHIQISKEGYYEHKNSDAFTYIIDDYDRIIEEIKKIPEVDVVSERLEFLALSDSLSGKSETVIVRGIIPSKENEFNTFFSKKEGRSLSDTDYGSAELGIVLADNLDINISDHFTLQVVDADGFMNAVTLQAKSFIGSYSDDFDSRIVRISLSTVQSLFGINGVHEIAVILDKTSDTDRAYKRICGLIKSEYPGLAVTTWKDHSTYYDQVVQFYGTYYRIILLIVAVVVFLSEFNTVMLGVNERLPEFGTMQSFGASRLFINVQIFTESFLLAFVSLIFGFILSFSVSSAIAAIGGIHIPPPPGISSEVYVYIRYTLKNIIVSIALGITVALISSLFTVFKVSRKSIIELLGSSYR